MPKERRKLLITGCGRSGTLYAAIVWQSLGLDIRHERPVPPNGVMGADGVASWFMAADDPNPPSGPSPIDYEFDVVIHQVRHPLKVIASMAQFILKEGKRAPGFIERNASETKLSRDEEQYLTLDRQLILRAARYWYYWNLLAEAKSDRRIRIEDFERELPALCDLVCVSYRPDVLDGISKDINARRYHVSDAPWEVTWEDIIKLDMKTYEKVMDMALKYGYRIIY